MTGRRSMSRCATRRTSTRSRSASWPCSPTPRWSAYQSRRSEERRSSEEGTPRFRPSLEQSDLAGLELVDRADDHRRGTFVRLHEIGGGLKLPDRLAHVRLDPAMDPLRLAERRVEILYRRFDLIQQLLNAGRFVRPILRGQQRRSDRATALVPQHQNQRGVEMMNRILDASEVIRPDHVSGHADDEQVTEALIEQ